MRKKILSTRRDFYKPYFVRIEENLNAKKILRMKTDLADWNIEKWWNETSMLLRFSFPIKRESEKFKKTLLSLANVSIVGILSISPSIIPFAIKFFFDPRTQHEKVEIGHEESQKRVHASLLIIGHGWGVILI